MHLSVVAFVSPRNRRRRRRRKCNPSKKECAEMMYSTIENCFEVFPHFFSVCPPTKELGWWWSKIVHYFTSKAIRFESPLKAICHHMCSSLFVYVGYVVEIEFFASLNFFDVLSSKFDICFDLLRIPTSLFRLKSLRKRIFWYFSFPSCGLTISVFFYILRYVFSNNRRIVFNMVSPLRCFACTFEWTFLPNIFWIEHVY